MGPCLVPFGDILGTFGGTLGSFLVLFWDILGNFGGTSVSLWSCFGTFVVRDRQSAVSPSRRSVISPRPMRASRYGRLDAYDMCLMLIEH